VRSTARTALARTGLTRAVRAVDGWHRPLAWFAASMVVWALVSVLGYLLDPRLLAGDHIWGKPLKFTISLTLYAVTLAWMTSRIRSRRLARVAWWAGTFGALSSLVEITTITVQVVRGTSSHFNVSTPFDAAAYFAMGSGVVFLYSAALVNGVVLLFSSTITDRVLTWAVRLGLLIGVAGLSVGFLMVRPTTAQLIGADPDHLGSHSVGGDDTTAGLPFLGWNTEHGDLRVAHFVGMHALQVLPLLALVLTGLLHHQLHPGTRLQLLLLAAAGYASLTGLTLWQALRGQSVIHPDALTVAVAAALAAIGVLHAAIIATRECSQRREEASRRVLETRRTPAEYSR